VDAEILVVGGGYAGLAAGALLSRSGHSAILLERSERLGGRASWTERDGFLLEHGLHDNRFAGEGAAAAVFRELGRELEFIEPGEPELWLDGEFVPLPNSLPKIMRSRLLGWRDRAAAARALVPLVLASPEKLFDKSLGEMLGKNPSPSVRRILSVLSGIGIIAPELDQASAGEFAAFLRKALKSRSKVGYPRGGTRSIIEGLREALEENGRALTGVRVEGFNVQKGRVVEALAGERSWRGEAVISAVPVQELPGLFGRRNLPLDFLEKAESLVPTAGISLEAALSSPVSGRRGLLVTAEPLTMGQFTSNIDPSTAPSGKQLLSWYYPLPAALMKDGDAVQAEEQRLRELLEEMFPGMREKTEWERAMRLGRVDGFLPSPSQSRPHRPGFRVAGLENFFVAGDGTGAEGTGGDAAFDSALRVSRLALEFLRSS
jgi:phytoene dehydrogenase-like protein